MANHTFIFSLIGAIALAGAVVPLHANEATAAQSAGVAEPGQSAAELSQTVAAPSAVSRATAARELSAQQARRLAREARKKGEHDRAAEYFTLAGDHSRAQRELLRAAADRTEVAKRNAEDAAELARMQARQLRNAFR